MLFGLEANLWMIGLAGSALVGLIALAVRARASGRVGGTASAGVPDGDDGPAILVPATRADTSTEVALLEQDPGGSRLTDAEIWEGWPPMAAANGAAPPASLPAGESPKSPEADAPGARSRNGRAGDGPGSGAGTEAHVEPAHVAPDSASRVPRWIDVPGEASDEAELGPYATVQLLPGRLEITSGAERGRLIPLFRLPGGSAPEITIGRAPPAREDQVQLDDPTVSAAHVRLRYEGGGWSIENLSRTNPVRINEEALRIPDAPRRLRDGDRVRLGAVELRFHQ